MRIGVVTRSDRDTVESYLGFGYAIVEEARSWRDGVALFVVEGPDDHAEWQARRLDVGLHFTTVFKSDGDEQAWRNLWMKT